MRIMNVLIECDEIYTRRCFQEYPCNFKAQRKFQWNGNKYSLNSYAYELIIHSTFIYIVFFYYSLVNDIIDYYLTNTNVYHQYRRFQTFFLLTIKNFLFSFKIFHIFSSLTHFFLFYKKNSF